MMSEGIPYADIIILALIAGFILLRLRSILGDKIGNDDPSYFHKPMVLTPSKQETIVQLDEKSTKPGPRDEPDAYLSTLGEGALTDTLLAIKVKDPQFSASFFLEGAKAAFEMVFDAFAKGDSATLKMLLSDTVYDNFSREISARDAQEHKTEHTLISVKAKDITSATLAGNLAHVTVHFVSEQVTVVRDVKGTIIEGNPSDIAQVEDYWVFERDITSKSPNWKVIET